MSTNMTGSDLIMVLAMLVAPLVGIEVSRRLDARRERRERQFRVFRTLMATRARKLSAEHVEALNLIDVEFHRTNGSEEAVAIAWKEYVDHLSSRPGSDVWGAKADDLFLEMLHRMSVCLGYKFDKVHLKNQSYSPNAHGAVENEQHAIRKGVLAVLSGERALPIRPVAGVAPDEIRVMDARAIEPPKPNDRG